MCSAYAAAQTDIGIALLWPTPDKPSLKLTFGAFQQSGVVDGQGIFVSDVTAQNVMDQSMPRSVFTVFISNKDGVRIGRARLQLPEIPPYRTQKAQLQFSAAGVPAGVTLVAGKTIPLKVISIPDGANLKIDGVDSGVTPRVVDFTIGTHTLEFTKEGYAAGSTPLEVAADELPGGKRELRTWRVIERYGGIARRYGRFGRCTCHVDDQCLDEGRGQRREIRPQSSQENHSGRADNDFAAGGDSSNSGPDPPVKMAPHCYAPIGRT
jgi:PEGA domain